MANFLNVVFLLVLSFTAMDYTLGRAQLRDPVRIVIAAVFAVLFVFLARNAANLF